MDIDVLGKLIAAVAASSGALYAAWRWLRGTSLAKAIGAIADGAETKEIVQDLAISMAAVRKEVTPNHGSSLRDAVIRIEQGMGRQRSLLRAYEDSHNRPMFEANASGEWLWVTTSLARLLGRSVDQLKGWGWINSLAPGDQAALRAEIASARSERREVQRRVEMVTANDERLVTDWRMTPVTAERGGEALEWLGHVRPYVPTGRHPAVSGEVG